MTAENTIAHPKLSNQLWKYIGKVWAVSTFVPGVFMLLAFPLFGILTVCGGLAIVPLLILLYLAIKWMYWHKYRPYQVRIAVTFLFIAMVVLAVCIMELLMGFLEPAYVVFAFPVFICGLIAVWNFDLPENS
jgi:hypothetical protein